MENHTPGPWSQHAYSQKEARAYKNSADGFHWVGRHITIGHGKKIIGHVEMMTPCNHGGFPHVEREDEMEANARLIMAAPLMLEILSMVARNAELIPDPSREGAADCYALPLGDLDRVREIIAKAEGRV